MISIYDYRDYRQFLKDQAAEKGLRSGFKSEMAKACGCNSAYISSILAEKSDLSLEQAERLVGHLSFSADEAHFFILLVQSSRAGTRSLRQYFERQIDSAAEQKLNVQRRLGSREHLSKQNQARYYSSWIYAAVHVALSIPRLAKSREALAGYFGTSVSVMQKTLDFLVSSGLAALSKDGYAIGPRNIHLGKDSDNIQRHHTNWRLQAMKALEGEKSQNGQGLNYSAAVTLSNADALKVREILLSTIKTSVDLIMASKEEEVFALNIDFFSLGNQI